MAEPQGLAQRGGGVQQTKDKFVHERCVQTWREVKSGCIKIQYHCACSDKEGKIRQARRICINESRHTFSNKIREAIVKCLLEVKIG